MSAPSFTMHRLAKDESARRAAVEAVRSTPNGEIERVETAIAAFERKYELSSTAVLERIERHELPVTSEIERWLMLISMRNDLAELKRSAR